MKITIQADGPTRKLIGNVTKREIEVPEGTTVKDALKEIDIIWGETKGFGFVVINGKKQKEDFVVSDGDKIKVFGRAFGG